MNIELTRSEFEVILTALGMALAEAMMQKDKHLAKTLLETTNSFGKHSPHFQPYEIPVGWK